MSTPGGIEFNHNIFSSIHDNGLEFFSNQSVNSLVLSGGDFFRFKGGFKSSSSVVSVEFNNGFSGDFSTEFVFKNSSSSGGVDNSKSGALFGDNSDIFSKSFSESISNLGGGHQDLSFKGRGSFVQGSGGSGGGFVIGNKKEESGEVFSENSLGRSLIKVHDNGDRFNR